MLSTPHFEITANRGVITDAAGNRVLDAAVALTKACPHCGRRHVYQAREVACPLTAVPET
jgi:hypothetical protein